MYKFRHIFVVEVCRVVCELVGEGLCGEVCIGLRCVDKGRWRIYMVVYSVRGQACSRVIALC